MKKRPSKLADLLDDLKYMIANADEELVKYTIALIFSALALGLSIATLLK